MLTKLRVSAEAALTSRAGVLARSALLVLALLGGSALLIQGVHAHYPIDRWLVWRYLGYWAGALYFALACQCAGLAILGKLGHRVRLGERVLLAQVVGTVAFFLGMFGLGALQLYHPAVFFVWPTLLVAAGARDALALVKRLSRLRLRVPRLLGAPRTLLSGAAVAFGAVSLVILYSQIIHPLQVSYDARWYHLSLAEQYVAEGGIRRFPDGSYVNAYPQLTSFLYVWAFLVPGVTLFDKVELCAHMVFVLFLFILFGVTVLTRRLLRQRVQGVWAAVFLFPGLFLYDSGLHLGADHPAAFFAAPLALVAYLTFFNWSVRNWLVMAIVIAGATLTKYSVAALFAVPGALLVLRALFGLWRDRSSGLRSWLLPPLVGLLTILLLTAPHWLKNWAFYGNPFYPYAAALFPNQPWGDYNRRVFETWSAGHEWSPRGTLGARLNETFRAVPTFAFKVHDWPAFHRDVPVFGFLFSLTGLALPFVRGRTGRVWASLLATYVGIFLWYWGMHQDRYLQVLLPWMAATTAAILVLAWRSSHWAKLPVAALVVLQVAWGSDVPFIPGHAMLGKPPTQAAIELAQTGYAGQTKNRLRVFEPYESIARALEPGSRVLLHEHHMSLGLGKLVVQDWAHTQGLVDYGAQRSLDDIQRLFQKLGVTHMVWTPQQSLGWAGYAGDFAFFDFVRTHASKPKSYGGFSLGKVQSGPNVDLRAAKVAFFACGNGYAMGLYSFPSMNFPDIVVTDPKRYNTYPKPERLLGGAETTETLVKDARYVAFDPGCGVKQPSALSSQFSLLANRSTIQLWARKYPEH